MRLAREIAFVCALALVGCGDVDGRDDGAAGTGSADASIAGSGGAGPTNVDGPWETFDARPCPPDSALTWENFGGAFVLDYCTGCHGRARGAGERQGAPLDVTFDDPASIRALAARIWAVAADDNVFMPPVGGPDAETRRWFGEWLACGALTRGER